MAGSHGRIDTVVDPEADEATDLPSEFVDTDETSTHGGGRELRNVDGSHVGATSHTDTRKYSASEDETEAARAVGAEHHTGTKEKDRSEQHQTLLAAEEITADVGEQTSEEGTSLVDRNDVGLEQSQTVLAVGGKLELLHEGGQGESGSDEGRVIADGATGEGRDDCTKVDAPVVNRLGRRAVLYKSEESHGDGLVGGIWRLLVFEAKLRPSELRVLEVGFEESRVLRRDGKKIRLRRSRVAFVIWMRQGSLALQQLGKD